jgi:hypothetical protein
MTYHFDQSSLVFGYQNRKLLGMFFLFDGETFTRSELFGIFEHQADTLITVPVDGEHITKVGEHSIQHQIQEALHAVSEQFEELLERAAENQIKDHECQYQLALILH